MDIGGIEVGEEFFFCIYIFCGVFVGRVGGPGEGVFVFLGVLKVWDGEFIMSIL